MKESELERKFKQQVEKEGAKVLKFVSPGLAGVPDRIILAYGAETYFAEIKRPGQHLRPLQVYRKKQLEDLGYKVFVIDSVTAISDFIKFMREGGS